MRRLFTHMIWAALAVAAPQWASCAAAQSLDYGATTAGEGAPPGDAADAAPVSGGRGGRPHIRLTPYIEALQVVDARLSPGDDIVTWTALAAGVDGQVAGRNSQGSLSLRYERRIGWGRADSGDVVSGVARASLGLVPRTVTLDVGALATRTSTDGGAAIPGGLSGSATHLYSLYAGPTVATHAGDVALTGAYRIGYTELGSGAAVLRNGLPATVDLFDHSVTHNAEAHAGLRAGDVLPVGLGLGAGYYQEDISNLDQRVRDFHARADLTVPVSPSVALVGGVGYEDVEVSSRDVLRTGAGLPVVGPDGRYVTDKSAPRQIAYDTAGLIWDAGVTWRPSRRTALEAHVGRRYGSTTYYGSFGWEATRRSALNISVYDSIGGLGGQLNRALIELPTEFETLRNPATGDINGCVAAPTQGTQAPSGRPCLTSVLGLRSAVFRGRGIQASYAITAGRLGMGVAGGYDRRRFIAAPGTILASANGVVDENTWLSAWLSGRIDPVSSFGTYLFADWYRSGLPGAADGTVLGANANYARLLGDHVSANAALSIQGLQRAQAPDIWDASAVLGVRYTFF